MIRNEERAGLFLTIAGGVGLLALMLFLLGFFHSPAPPSGPVHAAPRRLGAVAGEIVDAKSARVVADATVEVLGLDGVSDHWLAPPDPDRPRRFELQGLPADRDFTLDVGAPGYVHEKRPARAKAGATAELGEFRLVPLVVISGTVVDANYQPQKDVEVVASGAKGPVTKATTDAVGAFRIADLAPDAYEVSARSRLGERSDRPVAIDGTSGGEAAPLQVEIFPTVSLKGRLQLEIGARPPDEASYGGRTSPLAPDGSFAFDDVFAGDDALCFRFGSEWRKVEDVEAPDDARAVDAKALEPAEKAVARDAFGPWGGAPNDPASNAAVVVRAVDEAGRPLAGAFVQLILGDTGLITRATARNGEATLRGLHSGDTATLRVEFGHRMSFEGRHVVFRDPPEAPPFEVRCVPFRPVTVHVVDDGGAPVRRARVNVLLPADVPDVSVRPRETRGGNYLVVDEHGSATYPRLPPPPWSVEVDGQDDDASWPFEKWSSRSAAPAADGTLTIRLVRKGGGK
jgi:hypothetical protein